MNILYIISNLGSGGAEKLIQEMVPLINKQCGGKIDILLLTDKGNVFDVGIKSNRVKIRVIPLRNAKNPLNIYYIRKYIIEGKYDIVHAHLFPSIYWTSLASRLIIRNKPKFIMTEHSTHNRRREKIYLRCLEKFIYVNYNKIISISKETEDKLKLWLNLKCKEKERFITIENGVNIDKFIDAVPYKKYEINSDFSEDTKLICMVGRFSQAKDQPTLIKAVSRLKNIHLLLVGEGPLQEKNRELAKSEGVSDRVHFLGFRNDVEKIIKTVDIVVLSSKWEGFGLAAVEGMAAGKLVLATDVGGVREVINDGELLFSISSYNQLSDKIKFFLKDREQYIKKAKYLRERSKEFHINTTVNNYMELYQSIFDS